MIAVELKRVPLADGVFIPFVGITKNLGRAEFQICPQWKRGKLVKLSIYRLQQENVTEFYEWDGTGRGSLSIQSYQNLDEPKVWDISFCKEHKCPTIRIYVPKGANFLWFTVFSFCVTIGFVKTKF